MNMLVKLKVDISRFLLEKTNLKKKWKEKKEKLAGPFIFLEVICVHLIFLVY